MSLFEKPFGPTKPRERWNFKRVLSLAVLAVLVAWAGYYVAQNWSEFGAILHLDWRSGLVLLAATLAFFVLQGIVLRVSVAAYGVTLTPTEWFGLTVITFFANYAIPFSGIGLRGVYLNRVRGLAYADFASALAAVVIVELFVFALGGLAGLAALPSLGVPIDPYIALILGTLLIGLVVAAGMPADWLIRRSGPLARLEAFFKSWQRLKRQPMVLCRLTVLTVALFAANVAMFALAFRTLAFKVPMAGGLIAAALSDLSLFIRIAPAGAGTFEGSVIYVVHLFGLSIAEGLVVAAVVRIAIIVCCVSLGPIFFYYLIRRRAGG
jgi:uncharacterized membrane protein YbhN (UPF0104 family)